MNSEIVEYLNKTKPDFDSGFALFCKYSRNRTAMDWIGRRHDFPKLMYELGKLAQTTVSISAPASPCVNASLYSRPADQSVETPAAQTPSEIRKLVFRTFDDRRTKRSELPPDLQEVFDRNAEDYKLRRAFHEKMKMAMSDHDRALFRSKVIETDARIREGWGRIDSYFENRMQEKSAEQPFDELRCRRYVSKILHLDKPSPRQIADCKARVKTLLEHGCVIKESTLQALEAKGLT